jgi:hypothetical protein
MVQMKGLDEGYNFPIQHFLIASTVDPQYSILSKYFDFRLQSDYTLLYIHRVYLGLPYPLLGGFFYLFVASLLASYPVLDQGNPKSLEKDLVK